MPLRPGNVALQAALWAGVRDGRAESFGLLGVQVPVSAAVGLEAYGGVQRSAEGRVDARDAIAAVAISPVRRADLTVVVRPGLSIPTGGLGGALTVTPRSTASLVPWLAADVLVGVDWIVGASGVARWPLYAGGDDVRQGPFLRGDLRLARRFAQVVPFVGASAVRQGRSAPANREGDFTELALIGGAVWHVAPRWSLTGRLRVPLYATVDSARTAAGGLAVRAVLGQRARDDHHDDDGHDHGADEP